MTKTYAQLMKQIEALNKQAEMARRKEIEGVVSRIKEAIEVYHLTAADLGLAGGKAAPKAKAVKTVARKSRRRAGARGAAAATPKYRNEAGQVWGGRGPRPKWLREALASGKTLADFAV